MVRRLLSALRVRIFVLAEGLLSITGTAAVSQDAFEAALATLPGEVREVNSAGRWRTCRCRRCVLRNRAARGIRTHRGPAVYPVGSRWSRGSTASRHSHTHHAVAPNCLRILVNARHGYTRERRQFVFFATASRIYADRRVPSSQKRGPCD